MKQLCDGGINRARRSGQSRTGRLSHSAPCLPPGPAAGGRRIPAPSRRCPATREKHRADTPSRPVHAAAPRPETIGNSRWAGSSRGRRGDWRGPGLQGGDETCTKNAAHQARRSRVLTLGSIISLFRYFCGWSSCRSSLCWSLSSCRVSLGGLGGFGGFFWSCLWSWAWAGGVQFLGYCRTTAA